MFIGHLGVALALKRADKELNVCWLFTSAMFLDIVLWLLVLLNVEQVHVPRDFSRLHYLTFEFPYSHGLLGSCVCSFGVYFLSLLLLKRKKAALALALGVFSHFLLDLVVHIPELPLVGEHSDKVGLGLCNHMVASVVLEICLTAIGLFLYQLTVSGNGAKNFGMIIYMVIGAIFFSSSQFLSPAPTSVKTLAEASILLIFAFVFVAFLLDRGTVRTARHNEELQKELQ